MEASFFLPVGGISRFSAAKKLYCQMEKMSNFLCMILQSIAKIAFQNRLTPT